MLSHPNTYYHFSLVIGFQACGYYRFSSKYFHLVIAANFLLSDASTPAVIFSFHFLTCGCRLSSFKYNQLVIIVAFHVWSSSRLVFTENCTCLLVPHLWLFLLVTCQVVQATVFATFLLQTGVWISSLILALYFLVQTLSILASERRWNNDNKTSGAQSSKLIIAQLTSKLVSLVLLQSTQGPETSVYRI